MEQEEILGDPEVTEYLLQITQPSQYGYAKSKYSFAVTSGSPSKCHKVDHLEAIYTAGVGEGLFADEVCLGAGLLLTKTMVLILDGNSEHVAHA